MKWEQPDARGLVYLGVNMRRVISSTGARSSVNAGVLCGGTISEICMPGTLPFEVARRSRTDSAERVSRALRPAPAMKEDAFPGSDSGSATSRTLQRV